MRCTTSGRFTPAAANLDQHFASPGTGSGRAGSSTSGPPGAEISIAVIISGRATAIPPLPVAGKRRHIDSGEGPVNTRAMDMDENLPLRGTEPLKQLLREDWIRLSIDELKERIER
jgi:hypothetical protein